MAKLLRIALPLVILGLGYLGYQSTSEKAEAPQIPRRAPRVIETEATVLQRVDYQVQLNTQGIVKPHNETSLTPRISGRITAISPKFENGSFFEKDEILLELDPTDFEAALASAEARLARSEAALAQEEARAEQALLDWNDLDYEEPPTDLVLRKPQLKEARANVKASTAELSDAQRNLTRTKVRAPYRGRVKERLVGLGQSVSPGTKLGDIFSTDFAEIRLPLSIRELDYIDLPDTPGDLPIPVTLIDALSTENPATWNAQVVRTEGTLDEKSRKLFVIARIDDPFALKNPEAPSLKIGQPMRAILAGKIIPDVFMIPRLALRRPDEIVLIEPEELTLQKQTIVAIWSDEENLIVRDDITPGWLLSTSRLPNVPKNAPVQIIEPESQTGTIEAASTTSQATPDA
ncbi:MAG: efflux RND transporter periplasmic adaptor subunit [Akkermansiaceae bacterium]